MVTIRSATIKDITTISRLGKKTFDQSFGSLFADPNDVKEYLDQSFDLIKLKRSFAKPTNYYWLVNKGNKAVGYAKVQVSASSDFISSTNVCKLQRTYILKEYLGDGIGTRLHQIILDKARELGYEYIWLSVLKSNEKATRFYERKDYKIIGEHPFTIGKEYFEFWVMAKKLL